MKNLILKNKPLDEIIFLSNTVEVSGVKSPLIAKEYGTKEYVLSSWLEPLSKIHNSVTHIEADETAYHELKSRVDSGMNLFVINFSEGLFGRDRETQMPAILELLGIAYSGGGPLNKSLVLNKSRAKQIFQANNVPTAPFVVAYDSEVDISHLSFPLFLKPNCDGSSIGISELSKVDDLSSFKTSLDFYLNNFKQPILIEEYLSGNEFSVGLLGNEILPVISKDYGGFANFQSSDIKYSDKVHYSSPANIDISLKDKLQSIAKKAFMVTACEDISRLDFRLDSLGNSYVLEINSPPGVGPESSLWTSISAAGYSRPQMIERIITNALKRYNTNS